MPSPDEAAGYRAAIHHTWARGCQGRPPTMPGMAEHDPPPQGATDDYAAGWRAGITASPW